jgi:folate-binding protein YgfZ
MATASPFSKSEHYQPAETVDQRGTTLPARFGAVADEYRSARGEVALFDRNDRGLLIVTGADRKNWLHNLVTNAVRTLDDNLGNYAFAIDLQGRIQFDLKILSLAGALWLDVDAATATAATAHLDRYLVSEDVRIDNATARYARLGCSGPRAAEVAGRLGVTDFPAMPALSSFGLDGGAVRFLRHDFAGLPGFELIVPHAQAATWWQRLVQDGGAAPAGQITLDVLRLEAGIPWPGSEIDRTVLPPETGQLERAVSYHKGCYLGQEIIERMRSRGSVARRLVRLRTNDAAGLTVPTPLYQSGSKIGSITSLARHPLTQEWLGLAYIKTKVAEPINITAGDPPRAIQVESS